MSRGVEGRTELELEICAFVLVLGRVVCNWFSKWMWIPLFGVD